MSEIKKTTAADVNAASKLSEKYRDKDAHEDRSNTAFSGGLVFTLHFISAAVAIASIWNIPMSDFAKFAIIIAAAVICFFVEKFKSQYMESYFILLLKGTDNDKYNIDEMRAYLQDSIVEKTKMAAFWLISFVILCVTLSLSNVENSVLEYDTSVKDAYIQSVATLKNLTERNAKAAILKDAQIAVDRTGAAWKIEKEYAEKTNYRSILNAILKALIASLLIEIAIFYTRRWHEREQYKIAKSFEQAQIGNQKDVKKANTEGKDFKAIAEKQAAIIAQLQKDSADAKQLILDLIEDRKTIVATKQPTLDERIKEKQMQLENADINKTHKNGSSPK